RSDLVDHALHVGASQVAGRYSANKRPYVAGDVTRVDSNRRRRLCALPPGYNAAVTCCFKVGVAQLCNAYRFPCLGLLSLRIAPLRRSADMVFGAFACLLGGKRAICAYRQPPLLPTYAHLGDKNFTTRRINPD